MISRHNCYNWCILHCKGMHRNQNKIHQDALEKYTFLFLYTVVFLVLYKGCRMRRGFDDRCPLIRDGSCFTKKINYSIEAYY